MQTTRLKLLARTYLTFHGRLDFLPDKLQPVVLASRSFVVGQEITEIDALPAYFDQHFARRFSWGSTLRLFLLFLQQEVDL